MTPDGISGRLYKTGGARHLSGTSLRSNITCTSHSFCPTLFQVARITCTSHSFCPTLFQVARNLQRCSSFFLLRAIRQVLDQGPWTLVIRASQRFANREQSERVFCQFHFGPLVQYIDLIPSRVENVAHVLQRQVPTIQTVQKTMEVPETQCLDRMARATVVSQRQVSTVSTCSFGFREVRFRTGSRQDHPEILTTIM